MTRPALVAAASLAATFLVLARYGNARTETPPEDPPLRITFGGAGFHAVELDGYGLAVGPHWPVRPGLPYLSPETPAYYAERGAPVAYVGGSTPEVTVEARVPDGWAGPVNVRGSGGDGLRFAGEGTAGAGRLRAVVRAERPLPGPIGVTERLRIAWTAERDDSVGGGTLRLGESRNAGLYVLRDKPIGPLLHTPLHLAATRARGLTDREAVIARVWDAFTTREVRRIRDEKVLRYYGEYNDTAPAELRRMLVAGTGQCVAWSYLLYAALGSQGIEGQVVLIAPPGKGRLFVRNWRFVEGRRFIDVGPNGVAETAAMGDDVVLLPRGTGRPHARLWTAPAQPVPGLTGDDTGAFSVGPNGIADTPALDEGAALRTIAPGFGLENQRAYVVAPDAKPEDIRLGGDDRIARQINTRYVLTGPNGILETARQPEMRPGRAVGSQWDPTVGRGSTSIRVEFALPRGGAPVPRPGGDDRARGWWLDAGPDGVSQTPGAGEGRGTPGVVAVGAGPNGILDSEPGGDDRIVDLSEYLDRAPEGYAYVNGFNMWPLPGVRAQGNDAPPPDYPNHMILQVGDRYYDPSYGTGPFRSQVEWERASLAGVGVRIQGRDGENVRHEGRIVMVARKKEDGASAAGTLTSFIRTLPPD